MSISLRSFFLSDLHLFARRSKGHAVEARIHESARRAHTMVLGGDIFDFKWSTRPSLEHSIAESISWLEELVSAHPQCAFHFLLGNHDSHPKFVSELDRLAFRLPRLEWQPYVLRLGNCVFLHGDIIDAEPNEATLAERREARDQKRPPPRISHLLYDAVVLTRMHRFAARMAKSQRSILRKLTHYLSEQGLDAAHGVRDVYFGHTHRVVDGVKYGGLTFHNGGASIKGLTFRIIETRLPHVPDLDHGVSSPIVTT